MCPTISTMLFPPYLPFGNRNAQNFFPKNFDFGGDYVFKIV